MTLEGAADWVAPPFPLPFPLPFVFVLTNGTPPCRRSSVTSATTRRPAIDERGREPPTERSELERDAARAGSRRSGHDACPARSGSRSGSVSGGPPKPWRPEVATSRISSWSDSNPPNRPAGQPRHDVEPVALVDDLGDVRPAEGDAVEDVAVRGGG